MNKKNLRNSSANSPKKVLTICTIMLLFCLTPLSSASALVMNLSIKIVDETFTNNTDWISVDLSEYSFWESGIRALYIEILAGYDSCLSGDQLAVTIRPFGDTGDIVDNNPEGNIRGSLVTSVLGAGGEANIQYVWLPLNNSNKIEYRVNSLIECNDDPELPRAGLELRIVGHDGSNNVQTSCESNHFLCYKAKKTKGSDKFQPKQVSLLDEFIQDQAGQPKLFNVIKEKEICTAVDKNGEGIINPDNHLTCYTVKRAKGESKHQKIKGVEIDNQFGSLQLNTVKEVRLCVPSTITSNP